MMMKARQIHLERVLGKAFERPCEAERSLSPTLGKGLFFTLSMLAKQMVSKA